jgi:DNA repair protein RadC
MHVFSEITINWKPLTEKTTLPKIKSSLDAARVFRTYWTDRLTYKEEFFILLLNQANQVLGISKISEGGLSGTVVDSKMIFQAALKANAAAIVLGHNHPSGSLTPSEPDKDLTRKVVRAGKVLDIRVLDHIILTYDSYLSFADEGLI